MSLSPDVQVGAVKVGGQWIASDLIAAVRVCEVAG